MPVELWNYKNQLHNCPVYPVDTEYQSVTNRLVNFNTYEADQTEVAQFHKCNQDPFFSFKLGITKCKQPISNAVLSLHIQPYDSGNYT